MAASLDVAVFVAAIALVRLILFVHTYFTLGLVGVMVSDVEILVIVRIEEFLLLGFPSTLSLIKVCVFVTRSSWHNFV